MKLKECAAIASMEGHAAIIAKIKAAHFGKQMEHAGNQKEATQCTKN